MDFERLKMPNERAASHRRPDEQSDGSRNCQRDCWSRSASTAAVAGRWTI